MSFQSKVTVFQDILDTSTPFYRDYTWVLDRIKGDFYKEEVGLIRIEDDKEKKANLKKKLNSVLFCGEFTRRKLAGLKELSGLMCLDFDKFESPEVMAEWRTQIEADPYTLACFTSPSGDGIKVLVRIPREDGEHKAYFAALKEHYNCNYFDSATSDVTRVCFVSHDPTLYHNEGADIWMKKVASDIEVEDPKTPIIPMSAESDIINNLTTWWNKKFGSTKGSRNQNMFVFAKSMSEYGVDKSMAERHLSQYAESDFPVDEIMTVIRSAYNDSSIFRTKFFEDSHAVNKIGKMVRTGKSIQDISREFKTISPEQLEDSVDKIRGKLDSEDFWTYNDKGKISVSPFRFKSYLEGRGIFKFYPTGSGDFIFVQIESNMLTETSKDKIKDTVLRDLLERSDIGTQPFDHMAKNTSLFKADFLNMLETAEITLMEDTATKSYLYYLNCALEITKEGVKKIDYVDLGSLVWKDQIINRNFTETTDDEGNFSKFMTLVSNKEDNKLLAMRSVIGYLMSGYKNSGNSRAIILNDEVISDVPNGGSGKGLICNSLGHMKRTSTLDGKQFSWDDQFRFQTVALDSQLLIFDDVLPKFQMIRLFSVITEGLTIERKNKNAVFVPVDKSPKIIITTNHSISGNGGSFERRKHEVELSSYFGVNHTPVDEFGEMFFSNDWSVDEWQKFDSFMIESLQIYLEKGLVADSFTNLALRKFIQDTSPEFHEWSEERHNIARTIRVYTVEASERFQREHIDMKGISQKKFKSWIKVYADKEGLEYTPDRDRDGAYFTLTDPKAPDAGLDF